MRKSILILAIAFFSLVAWTQEQAMPAKEYTSPREYLDALNNALVLYQQKKITALEFERVFFPPGKMQFFLSYNYDDPEVATVLQRIQKARVSESIASNISAYISGQQKQRDIYIRKAHPEIAKPVPLLSGGLAPPDPLPSTTPDPMSAPLWLNAQKAAGKSASPSLGPNDQSPPVPPVQKTVPTTSSPAAKEVPSGSFPIVPVAILTVVIMAVIVFLLRRKSP